MDVYFLAHPSYCMGLASMIRFCVCARGGRGGSNAARPCAFVCFCKCVRARAGKHASAQGKISSTSVHQHTHYLCRAGQGWGAHAPNALIRRRCAGLSPRRPHPAKLISLTFVSLSILYFKVYNPACCYMRGEAQTAWACNVKGGWSNRTCRPVFD
jgi:hypothetical protein